jgi:ABC-2 type transport system ATP-binding protein
VSPSLPPLAGDAQISPPALDVVEISHRYGSRVALDRVSLRVNSASFTVLLGLNGAGKSTLFSLITRLFATQRGRISIYGHDISRQTGAALSQLGIVFQSRALDADISVLQNLVYHAALHGMGRREAVARASVVMARVGLADRIGERVNRLSGGQIRRVEIARALLHRPRLLLLDEPTAGLDVKARAAILSHVRALLIDEGIGVLWATHLIDEAARGDDVAILHEGRILAQGKLDDIVAASGENNMGGAFARLVGCTKRDQEETLA